MACCGSSVAGMTRLPQTRMRAACEHEGETEGTDFCSSLESHPASLAGMTRLPQTQVRAACEHEGVTEGVNFCSPLESHPSRLACWHDPAASNRNDHDIDRVPRNPLPLMGGAGRALSRRDP